MFSCESCENFINNSSYKTPPVAASICFSSKIELSKYLAPSSKFFIIALRSALVIYSTTYLWFIYLMIRICMIPCVMCNHLVPPSCLCLCTPPHLCLCCYIILTPLHLCCVHKPKSIPLILSTTDHLKYIDFAEIYSFISWHQDLWIKALIREHNTIYMGSNF